MQRSRMQKVGMISIMVAGLLCCNSCDMGAGSGQTRTDGNKKRVLLVGASIGQEWNLHKLSTRLKDDDYAYESVAAWQYDKTEALEEVLMRPKRKFRLTRTYMKGFFQPAPLLPHVIIIKECASYFPGDQALYQELIKKWIDRLRQAQIQPILATVVPVTRERAAKRSGQVEAIWKFNDWIREYARTGGHILLDLEASLRKSPTERYLRDDLSSDGQHLNGKAYDILDLLLLEMLHGNRQGVHKAH